MPRTKVRYLPRAIAAALVAFSLLGCTAAANTDPGAAAPAQAETKTLVGSFESVPAGMDPGDRANLHHFAFSPVLSQLVLFAEGDGEQFAPVADMVPDLAESWERGEDGSVTFQLRETVSSAGNPLTAEDVKWSIERTLEMNNISQTVWRAVGGDAEEPVTVVDDSTVRLNSSTGNESLLGAAALFEFGIIDRVAALEHATAGDPWAAEWMRTNLPSFGPYAMTSFVPDTEIVYDANPNYWGADDLFYNRVVNRAVTDASTLVSLMQTGQLDFAMPIPFSSLTTLRGVDGIVLDTSPTMLMTQLNLDLREEPFSITDVRKAMSMALDRDEINAGAYNGFATPSTGVVTRALSGATEPANGLVRDVDAAKALLAEAGYPDGFEFTLAYSAQGANAPEWSAVAQLAQQQLAEVGIKVNIDAVATPAEFSQGVASTLYKAHIGTQGPLLPDIHYLVGLRWAGETSGISPGFRNEDLIRLNAEAVTAAGADRERILAEMLSIANEQLPVIPIIDVPNQWAFKKGVGGTYVNGGQTIYPHMMFQD